MIDLPLTPVSSNIDLPLAPVPSNKEPLPTVLDFGQEKLGLWLKERNYEPRYAQQIYHWVFSKRATSFSSMTTLSKSLREELIRSFELFALKPIVHQVSTDHTHKLLLETRDQRRIECVLIQENNRKTACISTQVGCGMGCVFCASGLKGVERNLTSGEMIEQLIHLRNLTKPEERLTHIVVMGMGEPMANLEALLEALDLAVSPSGLGIGSRHITISTVGLPAKIKQFANLKKQYHLAVSLHAPNDILRTRIVPTNKGIGIANILEAADYFYAQTGRQVTYEYVLLGGINDSKKEAHELAKLLYGRKAFINLIPMNPVNEIGYLSPNSQTIEDFVRILRNSGLNINLRKRKGADIDAACGQLKQAYGMKQITEYHRL